MRRILVTLIAILPVALLASDGLPPTPPPQPAQARYSPEQLEQIRQSLLAQIAVLDQGEQAMRAPTPQEAAALAVAAESPREAVALPGGGVALRSAPSDLALSVATIGKDGSVRISHAGGHVPAEGEAHVR